MNPKLLRASFWYALLCHDSSLHHHSFPSGPAFLVNNFRIMAQFQRFRACKLVELPGRGFLFFLSEGLKKYNILSYAFQFINKRIMAYIGGTDLSVEYLARRIRIWGKMRNWLTKYLPFNNKIKRLNLKFLDSDYKRIFNWFQSIFKRRKKTNGLLASGTSSENMVISEPILFERDPAITI